MSTGSGAARNTFANRSSEARSDGVGSPFTVRWLSVREVEKRTGKPAAFIETDLVDPRYFSAANVKNRLESYFQMVKQKRTYGHPDPGNLARAIPIHAN